MKEHAFGKETFVSSFLFLSIFLTFWFSILLLSGSMVSGYHFIDDHEILRIDQELRASSSNVIQVSLQWIIRDLNIRFRPLYYFHRVLETTVFGTNLAFWSVYRGVLCVLTSFFFYLFGRKVGFSRLESTVLALLPFVGSQSAIWWRLGPNETFGVFLLSLCLLFMGLSIHSEKGKKKSLCQVLFVVVAMLMSLSKESFVLIIPAVLFWQALVYRERNKTGWIESVRNCASSTAILSLTFILELVLILFHVGTDKIGYAGVSSSVRPLQYIEEGVRLSRVGGAGPILLIAIIITVASNRPTRASRVPVFLENIVYPGVLFSLLVFPQIVLYAKSSIWERYLVPGILGYYVCMIYMLRTIRLRNTQLSKAVCIVLIASGTLCAVLGILTRVSGNVSNFSLSLISMVKQEPFAPHWIEILQAIGGEAIFVGISTVTLVLFSVLLKRPSNIIIYSLLMLAFVYNSRTAFVGASNFAREGRATKSFLESIQKNTEESSSILIVADPVRNNEWTFSLKTYLSIVSKRNDVYVYALPGAAEHTDFEEGLLREREIDCIAIFPEMEKPFLVNSQNWFDSPAYRRSSFNGFVNYFREYGKKKLK